MSRHSHNPAGASEQTTGLAGREQAEVRAMSSVTVLGAVVNLLLSGVKIAAGVLAGSQALIADGIHSLSDLGSDAVVYVAAREGSRGPDPEHPYGHARVETVATVAMGIILILVAAGITFDALRRVFAEQAVEVPGLLAFWVAICSVLVKEGLYRYTLIVARRVDSDLLRANAWHHRTDAVSSIIVVLALGGALMGLPWLDAFGAAGVALMIGWIGWKLAWRNVRELVDAGLAPDRVARIRDAIVAVDGVAALHMLRTRRMGGKALVDVHIMLDNPRISVSEGHQISETVLAELVRNIDEVADVTVHIDPEDDEAMPPNRALPLRRVTLQRLRQCWASIEAAQHIQRINLHYLNGKIHVEVQLPLTLMGSPDDAAALAGEFRAAIEQDPDIADVELLFG